MVLTLAALAAFFSLAAAILALAALLRQGRDKSAAAELEETVRGEADRSRSHTADQARGLRQELGESLRGFQDSLSQRLDNAGKAEAEAAQALRQELTGHLDRTSHLLAETLRNFGDSQHARLGEMRQQIAEMSDRQAQGGETLRKAVEERLDVLRQENSRKLDEMRQTVDEKLQSTLEKRLSESFTLVQTQLENVHKGLGEMQTLATGVGDLKRVLSNVKIRGTSAEIQIDGLLEQFLAPDQYVRNVQVKDNSPERVDFAVRYPSRDEERHVLLPIDAKFPKDDYERLVQAVERGETAAAEAAAAALEARVRSFARSVSEKYIHPPATTDFAILFLPTESLLAEMLRRPGLFDQLQRDYRVTLAGPTTLSAILHAFQMGFRSLAIQKRSSEVWQVLGAVKNEFAQHGKVVDALKRQLDAATNTIDKLGTRTRAMNRSLRNVEALPGSATLLGLTDEDAGGEADEAAE